MSVWPETDCRDGRLAMVSVWLGEEVPRWEAGIGVFG